MSKTISTDNILILWLLAAFMAIILLVSVAHTTKVATSTTQWQADTSWISGWNYIKNVAE